MIHLKISQQQIDKGKNHYPFDNLKNSVTQGKSKLIGALGEIAVADFFRSKGYDVVENDGNNRFSYDYDLLINGYKVEVKANKGKAAPPDFFEYGFLAKNTKQKCDFYFFILIKEDLSDAFLLGFKSRSEFFQKAKFYKSGDPMISGFKIVHDTYAIKVSEMDRFKFDKISQ